MSFADSVAICIFNGKHKCLAEEGFYATLEGLNAATITVPESFATKTGMFICQKGDLPVIENCHFPLIGKKIRKTLNTHKKIIRITARYSFAMSSE